MEQSMQKDLELFLTVEVERLREFINYPEKLQQYIQDNELENEYSSEEPLNDYLDNTYEFIHSQITTARGYPEAVANKVTNIIIRYYSEGIDNTKDTIIKQATIYAEALEYIITLIKEDMLNENL